MKEYDEQYVRIGLKIIFYCQMWIQDAISTISAPAVAWLGGGGGG